MHIVPWVHQGIIMLELSFRQTNGIIDYILA